MFFLPSPPYVSQPPSAAISRHQTSFQLEFAPGVINYPLSLWGLELRNIVTRENTVYFPLQHLPFSLPSLPSLGCNGVNNKKE